MRMARRASVRTAEAHELCEDELRRAAGLDQRQASDEHELAEQVERLEPAPTRRRHGEPYRMSVCLSGWWQLFRWRARALLGNVMRLHYSACRQGNASSAASRAVRALDVGTAAHQ